MAYKTNPWDKPAIRAKKLAGPPCEKCRPIVLPGNIEALAIYLRCQGQLILGPGGPVDINILAVMGLMDRMGIEFEEQDALLMKIQILAGVVLHEQAKKHKTD